MIPTFDRNKKLKDETKDIEEMVLLLKRLSSADRREIRGILIGLQLANLTV